MKGQNLSKAGKEVLVKSVLQAIPNYSMGCFQLTKGQCGKLTLISSRFWRGGGTDKRKDLWISWERICSAKRSGGLGFCDFHDFNQALLARQAWRLTTSTESLWSPSREIFARGRFYECQMSKKSAIHLEKYFAWKGSTQGGPGVESRRW
jgi:hypothetical protein